MFVLSQKSQWRKAEWSELSCQTVSQQYSSGFRPDMTYNVFSGTLNPAQSANDVGIIFVHWRKDIYSGHTEKPAEWPTVRTSIKQEAFSHCGELDFPRVNLATYGGRAFAYAGPTSWNSQPDSLKDINLTLQTFKRHLKTSRSRSLYAITRPSVVCRL